MIFDFRVFVGQSFDGTQQATTELLRTMDLLNVEMALVCPLKPLSYNLDQANANLAASLKDHAAAESLRRGLEVHDLRALYLNPWEESFRADMEQLDSLMQIAEAQASPVLVASGYPWLSGALQVRKLAQRWPNVPVVMTNGGQINISGLGQADATLALRQTPNLYIDTAGVYRQDFIEETVEAFGAERVLFGSGAPYFDQRYEIKRVLLAKVSDAARQAMQGDNALRMLGLLAG
jgi:predicted TIM-barrel fold metal-dependent hydrolase